MSKDLTPVTSPNKSLVAILKSDKIQQRFNEVLADSTKTKSFIATLINVINKNTQLSKCTPETLIGGALMAASMDLPLHSTFGLCALIPFKTKKGNIYVDEAQFQVMARGYIQLAIRSGVYKNIHFTEVYEDELEYYDPITSEIKFTAIRDRKQRDIGNEKKIVGYYSMFELQTGFKKELYMSKKEMEVHGKTFSKTYDKQFGMWKTNFHVMGRKTIIKQLLTKYGILSIELRNAIESDQSVLNDDNMTYPDNEFPNNENATDVTFDDFANETIEGVDNGGTEQK